MMSIFDEVTNETTYNAKVGKRLVNLAETLGENYLRIGQRDFGKQRLSVVYHV